MSELPDDVVAMRQRLRDRPLRGTEDLVPPEHLMQLLDGELSAEQARALADRIAREPDLATELRVTAELRRERDLAMVAAATEAASPTEAAANDPGPAGSRSWMLWTTIGALAAALIVLWLTRPPTLEHPGSDEIRAGVVDPPIESRVPATPVPRGAFELRWAGGPAEATYDVFVTTADLVVVHSAFDLTEPRLVVPAAALEALAPGSRVRWRVEAVTSDERRTSSAAFEATVE